MILSLGGQNPHGGYGEVGVSGGKKKGCRGETVSEQSATPPLKLLKPHKAKQQKPETHPGPESVDEAKTDAVLTGCDFGQKKRAEWEECGSWCGVYGRGKLTVLQGTVQQRQQVRQPDSHHHHHQPPQKKQLITCLKITEYNVEILIIVQSSIQLINNSI